MKGLLNKCPACGTYTMKVVCSSCGGPTIPAHPARYSPDDRYARYRNPMAYRRDDEDDRKKEEEQQQQPPPGQAVEGVKTSTAADA